MCQRRQHLARHAGAALVLHGWRQKVCGQQCAHVAAWRVCERTPCPKLHCSPPSANCTASYIWRSTATDPLTQTETMPTTLPTLFTKSNPTHLCELGLASKAQQLRRHGAAQRWRHVATGRRRRSGCSCFPCVGGVRFGIKYTANLSCQSPPPPSLEPPQQQMELANTN